MKIMKAFKYRIYPTEEQEANLRCQVGNCRFVWNKLLEMNNKFYELTKKFMWYYDFNYEIGNLKQEFDFLKHYSNSQSLQQVGMHLDRALKDMKHGKGYPKFKSKGRTDSFHVPQHVKFRGDKVFLAKTAKKTKDRWIKTVKHRPMQGKPKSLTVILDVDQWFVSVLCEIETKVEPKQGRVIGVDLGLNHFATLDDGTKIDNPRFLRKSGKSLARSQRKLSKRVKGSNNRDKQRIKVAKVHRKVRRQRSDFLHKVSSMLIAKASRICVEDLNVEGLKRSWLSKSVSDVGWSEFVRQLGYKCSWSGAELVKADRFYPSSKLCSSCGNKKTDLKLSDRTYICDNCGLVIDRDENAAINLSTVGATGIDACGDTSVGVGSKDPARHVSLKQEKSSNR